MTNLVEQVTEKRVYGIDGLATLLGCSKVTACKVKASGKIPFMQIGRKVIFDVEKVLKAIENKHKA